MRNLDNSSKGAGNKEKDLENEEHNQAICHRPPIIQGDAEIAFAPPPPHIEDYISI